MSNNDLGKIKREVRFAMFENEFKQLQILPISVEQKIEREGTSEGALMRF